MSIKANLIYRGKHELTHELIERMYVIRTINSYQCVTQQSVLHYNKSAMIMNKMSINRWIRKWDYVYNFENAKIYTYSTTSVSLPSTPFCNNIQMIHKHC